MTAVLVPRPIGVFYATLYTESGIRAGTYTDLDIPFDCTLTKWTLLADQSGTAQINVWRSTYSAYPPLVGGNIAAAAPPTVTGAVKATNSTLTGWTKTLSHGDVVRLTVNADTVITQLVISLEYAR